MTRQVDVKALVSHIVRGDGLDKCRICMGDTSQGQVHLTDTVMMDGDKAVTLTELLEMITGVKISEETCCPVGACVACASAALAAQEFRIFVKNSEKLWAKAVSNLTNLDCDDSDPGKSICAYVTPKDLAFKTTKDYSVSEPNTIINRSKTKIKKTYKKRKTESLFPCEDCGKVFGNPLLLQVHLKNSGDKDACLICGTITRRGKAMKDHIVDVHKGNAMLCAKCPALFTKSSDLSKHLRKAHCAGAYTCLDCGRTFPRHSSYSTHTQMHTVRICRSCDAQFTNRSCYREHRKCCEPDAKPDIASVPRNRRCNIRDPAIFICDYCQKQYTSRPELKNHIMWIHMDIRPHQCQWCGKRFYTLRRLNEHSVVHTRVRKFECDICGDKLVSKMAAVYHRRRHTGERPYKCEDCDAAFISSSRRLEHAKRKHNKGVRQPCPHCSSTFVRKTELNKHIVKVHSNNSWHVTVDSDNVETVYITNQDVR